MRLVDEEEMKEEREIKDGIPFVILFPGLFLSGTCEYSQQRTCR